MNHNIITPNAQRIICDAVTVNPFVGLMAGKSAPGPTFCAAVNGDAVFIYWGVTGFYPAPLTPITVLRVKPDGTWCWYLSGSPAKSVLQNHASCIQFSNNSFLLTINQNGYNRSAHVIVPDYFIPNGFVNFYPAQFSFPSAPCGAAPIDTVDAFYGENGHVLLEYIQSFPEAYNLWAATVEVTNTQVNIINAGACGNFPNGVDPIVDDSNTIVGGNKAFTYSNGGYSFDNLGDQIYRRIGFTDLPSIYTAVYNGAVTDGALNCAATGRFPRYSIIEQYLYDINAAVFNGYYFRTNASGNAAGSDLQCSASCTNQPAIQLFNGPNFVELATGGPGQYNAVYLKDSNVWIGIQNFGTLASINTPRAPLPDVFTPPPVVAQGWTSLLNWHRPISTRGLFKT